MEATGITTGATTPDVFSEPDKLAATNAHVMEAAGNEALRAYILEHAVGEPRRIVKGSWEGRLRSMEKMKNSFDPETEMNQIGATLTASRPTKTTDVKGLLTALQIAGAAVLDEAIVTEMAPPDLATRTGTTRTHAQLCQLKVACGAR